MSNNNNRSRTTGDNEVVVFAPDMNCVYYIQPNQVDVTEGSNAFLKNYDTYGVLMKKEHFLCTASLSNTCSLGPQCQDIHIRPESVKDVRSSIVHQNNEKCTAPRHKAGDRVEVYDHKSRQSVPVDSGSIIVTVGSEGFFKKLGSKEHLPRMQQCTHFQRRHCLRGPECGFVHAVGFTAGPTRSPGRSLMSLEGSCEHSTNSSPNTSATMLPNTSATMLPNTSTTLPRMAMSTDTSPNVSFTNIPFPTVVPQMTTPIVYILPQAPVVQQYQYPGMATYIIVPSPYPTQPQPLTTEDPSQKKGGTKIISDMDKKKKRGNKN
eukprot:PhF_6_TR44465/c0_g1_i1/m.68447